MPVLHCVPEYAGICRFAKGPRRGVRGVGLKIQRKWLISRINEGKRIKIREHKSRAGRGKGGTR